MESPGSSCSPQNFCQLVQTSLFGTAKKKKSIVMLSMTGKIGVASLANAVIFRLKVSPGKASSAKIGINHPASNAVLQPWDRSNELRGISAFGTCAKLCCITVFITGPQIAPAGPGLPSTLLNLLLLTLGP